MTTTHTTQSDHSSLADTWQQLARQFRTRYPDGLLDVTIELTDLERDLVILKAIAITGELLDGGKGCGLAAGSLMQIEHLALVAKRQALADLDISMTLEPLPTQQQEAHGDTPALLSAVSLQPSGVAPTESVSQESTLKPVRTAVTLKALYAKAYQVPALQHEARWRTFAAQVIGRAVVDEQLSEAEMERLHTAIQQQWQRRTAHPQLSAKIPSLPRKG